MDAIGLILFYVVGCVVAYAIFRHWARRLPGLYTWYDVSFGLCITFITSWLGAVVLAIVVLCERIAKGKADTEPPKWL